MALINLIRIDDVSGVLVADEEFWRRGTRRTLALDNLHPLLPGDYSESTGLEAVIGLEGDPSITYEAVLKIKNVLKEAIQDPSKVGKDEPIKTLKEIAEIAVREIDLLIRKRIDDQLLFAYGFTTDDLNRGNFDSCGKKVDIKLEQIRTDAFNWTKYNPAAAKTKQLFEMHALIAGLDARNGFHWYEWSGVPGNIFFGTGNFESIGKGSDAASLAFIDIFRKRELKKRRQGLSAEEALFAMMEAQEAALRFNHEVGGYPSFVILNGHGKTHAERFREYSGHGAKLAQEIVIGWIHGYLRKTDALRLVKALVLENADFDAIETECMKVSRDANAFEHFLRGYKSSIAALKEETAS